MPWVSTCLPASRIPGIGDIQSIEDFIVSNNLLPLGSLLYVVFCVSRRGWGWDNFLAEADAGTGMKFRAGPAAGSPSGCPRSLSSSSSWATCPRS